MLLFSVMMLAAATVAETPSETAAPAPVKKEKKICRVEDGGDPSSHFQKRTCLTAQQWDERARGASNTAGSGLSAAGSKDY